MASEDSEHLETAKTLADKADNMALGSAGDVINLASAHAAIALAEALTEVCDMMRAFYDEEFGEEPDAGTSEHDHDSDGCHACAMGMDEVERQMDEYIAEHGWAMTHIVDAKIPFGYTIGGPDPQFFISGMPAEQTGRALHMMKTEGEKILAEMGVDTWEEAAELNAGFSQMEQFNRPIFVCRKIDSYKAEMFLARNRGCELAIQIAWISSNGKYPWEEGYDHTVFPQEVIPEVL